MCCYEKPVWKVCDLVQGKDRVFTLDYDVLIVAVCPAITHVPMERIYGRQGPHRQQLLALYLWEHKYAMHVYGAHALLTNKSA